MAQRVPFVVAELGADADPFVLHQFADGLSVKRSLVAGVHRVELAGFTDGMVGRLKALGLVGEIIS